MNQLKLSDLNALQGLNIHLEERNGETRIYGSK